MEKEPIVVATILSPGHSGQTWLCMLIGSHSQGLSLGEIRVLEGKENIGEHCMLCGHECEFWGPFREAWSPERNLFLQLSEFSGKRLLAISRIGEFAGELSDTGIRAKWIRLIRDGRAVTASYLRKYSGRPYKGIVRDWVKASGRLDEQVAGLAEKDCMTISYEALLKNGQHSLSRVCSFLGVEFEATMLEYWKFKHHIPDGNRGTFSFVQREFAKDRNPVDRNFYASQNPRTFEDNRWRGELTPYQLLLFERIGGRLNRAYGYRSSPLLRSLVTYVVTRWFRRGKEGKRI
jgi:hypothetical protein